MPITDESNYPNTARKIFLASILEKTYQRYFQAYYSTKSDLEVGAMSGIGNWSVALDGEYDNYVDNFSRSCFAGWYDTDSYEEKLSFTVLPASAPKYKKTHSDMHKAYTDFVLNDCIPFAKPDYYNHEYGAIWEDISHLDVNQFFVTIRAWRTLWESPSEVMLWWRAVQEGGDPVVAWMLQDYMRTLNTHGAHCHPFSVSHSFCNPIVAKQTLEIFFGIKPYIGNEPIKEYTETNTASMWVRTKSDKKNWYSKLGVLKEKPQQIVVPSLTRPRFVSTVPVETTQTTEIKPFLDVGIGKIDLGKTINNIKEHALNAA
jgi:hypothetical protein